MNQSNAFIDNQGKLIIEGGRIIYRNFSGKETKFNHAGDKNFCVFIDDPAFAEQLKADGWNVKIRQPRDEGDSVSHFLKVNINYRNRGPKVFRHIGKATFECNQDTIADIDQDEIIGCDIIVNPYHWERDGKSGISGYLDTLHVVVKEDYFNDKYAQMPKLPEDEKAEPNDPFM